MLIIHLLKQKEEKEAVTEINKMTNYDNVSVLFSRFILNDKMIKCKYGFVSPTISDICYGKIMIVALIQYNGFYFFWFLRI